MPHVRSATVTDLDALVSGNAAMALDTEQLRLDPETLRQGVLAVLEGRAPGRYWVAEHDGTRRRTAAHHV